MPMTQSAYAHPTSLRALIKPEEDWTKISDFGKRRRMQNRLAQRKYRNKVKRLAGSSDDVEADKPRQKPTKCRRRSSASRSRKPRSTGPRIPGVSQHQFNSPVKPTGEPGFPDTYDDQISSNEQFRLGCPVNPASIEIPLPLYDFTQPDIDIVTAGEYAASTMSSTVPMPPSLATHFSDSINSETYPSSDGFNPYMAYSNMTPMELNYLSLYDQLYLHYTGIESQPVPIPSSNLALLCSDPPNKTETFPAVTVPTEHKGGSGNPAWQQQWVEWTNVLPSSNTQYLLICLGYVIIFAYHTRHSISAYYGHSRTKKSLALALHILAATFELTRYYFRAFRRTVQPDLFDTAACMIHSITSLRLARTLRRGDKTTRASYQAPAMLRPVLSFAAVVRQDAFAHEACVKLLHAFLYTRLLIFVAKRIGLGKIQSHSTIYARAVTLGAILAIRSSGLPAGVPIYVGAVGLVMVFNQQTPSNLPSSVHLMDGIERRPDTRVIRSTSVKMTKEKVQQAVTKVIHWLGLFEIKGFEMKHLSPAIPAGDIDEYTEQKLAAT
ncbi:hypothetical protein FOVSG1_015345 [Fusarium oxysporum f. sp. vasinfectum]